MADTFLACGILGHGVARIRCDACAHEYLLAFSSKCRYFCPSCHAKCLAVWTQWLDTTLLAPVPHRQVVLTIPRRLRAYGRYRRRLLGELARVARVAARTVTAAIRTLTGDGGERELAVGIVACLQTPGSRANWHPHLHRHCTPARHGRRLPARRHLHGTFVAWRRDTARAGRFQVPQVPSVVVPVPGQAAGYIRAGKPLSAKQIAVRTRWNNQTAAEIKQRRTWASINAA
ncbi:MAG: transposase zinc-binding domain-containing protein [Gemmatimonadota bacterium]